MNSNATHTLVDMANNEWRNLVTQVKETVATDVDYNHATSTKNTFAAAKLWQIQKNKRSSQTRRATLWN